MRSATIRKYAVRWTALLLVFLLIVQCAACSGTASETPTRAAGGTTLPARPSEKDSTEAEEELPREAVPLPEDVGEISVYDLTEDMIATDPATGQRYVDSVLLVYFDVDVPRAQRQELIASVGGEEIGRIDALEQVQVRVKKADLASLQALCEKLEQDPRVDCAEIDTVGETDSAPYYPDDPVYFTWDPEGKTNRNWGLIALNAPEAWAYRDLLEPVNVGIIDKGFSYGHPDLAENMTPVEGSTGAVRAHGTHVAGIIGAAFNNGTGMSGIAPNARLLTYGLKLNKHDEFHGASVYAAMTAVVTAGAKVVNLSAGGQSWATRESIAKTASRNMGLLLKKGYDFVVVQSSGNHSRDLTSNGFYSAISEKFCDAKYASKEEIAGRVIVVGSVERHDGGLRMSNFSTGGDFVDLCAPGTNIFSCVQPSYAAYPDEERQKSGNFINNYYLKDGLYDAEQDTARTEYWYDYDSGTSMAAPYVAGIAATVWGADPTLTGREVKELLCDPDNAPRIIPANPNCDASGNVRMADALLPLKAALTGAGKLDENGNVPGEETEAAQTETAQAETTEANTEPVRLTEDQKKARKIFADFMAGATEGGGFYPIAPDWLYVDNAYFYTTYLARFGLADADFDGEEELILYWNQMSQEGTVYVYDADLKNGNCVTGKLSRYFPTLSTDVTLTYYSGGTVELVDHETGYAHFRVTDGTFWSRHPELALPDYLQDTYLSVPETAQNGVYRCLIDDSADRAVRELDEGQMRALLGDLRSGASVTVQLYPVTQENLHDILQ